MLRSRKRQTGASASDDTTQEKRDHRSSSSSSGNGSLIPNWLLCAIVFLFILLGFASEHYNKTRSLSKLAGRRVVVNNNENEKKHAENNENLAPAKGHGRSMLSPEEDASLESQDGQRYHLIFSTDCGPYQDWQSYLVYFTAMREKQPGHVTRVVSGCKPEEEEAMRTWFREKIQYMSKRFHIHLTPKFSEVKDETGKVIGDYPFFNKPKGLKHFLEHFEMLEFHDGSFKYEDDIVILIDPDMPLLRPITRDFSNERETIVSKRRQGDHRLSLTVKRGVPFAQTYGLGTQWQHFDLDKIAGPNSPAKEVSKEDGALYFPVGPPYIGTVHDMYQIAQKWSEFVPHVHAQYPHLLAEMYAYCIAAAHLGLKHQLIDSLMVSNPSTGGEGWELVDRIPPSEMCNFASHPDHKKYALPSVAHLCQRYCVGEDWFFGKRRIPHDIYECESPLFIEPPEDLATSHDFKRPPNAKESKPLSPKAANQEAFMVCYLTRLVNEASTFYKENACSPGTANLQRTRTVAELFNEYKK